MACSLRVLAIALALQAGCFSDPPPVGGAGTTGGGCPVGSLGCPCTDGDGCDVGLQCLLSAHTCIDVDCTPGEGMCSCGPGMTCPDGFVCVDDYCDPVGSGTTTGPDPTLPTDPSTSVETLGTTGFTTDFTSTFDPSITSSPATTGATSKGSGVMPSTCSECMEWAVMESCAMHWPCTGCETLYDCFSMELSATCCADSPSPLDWNAFASCVDDVCQGLCPVTSCPVNGDISST